MPAYTCPACRSTNDISSPHTRRGVYVLCPACSQWFVPTPHVTDAKVGPPIESNAEALKPHRHAQARERLEAYATRHPEYLDRDRDILLIAIYDRVLRIR